MAVEEEVLLDISVQNRDALANIAQLSKANEDLKSSLDELKKAYKDGNDATDENIKQRAILEAQIKENNAGIRENSKEIKTNAANVASAADSINGMRARVADLTKSWNSLSAGAREGDVGKQIQAELGALNEGINTANISVNNFKDNIGNYPSEMGKVGIANTKVGEAMESLGISSDMSMKQMAQSVVAGTRAAGAAFAKLLLNPVVAFIAAIVAAAMLLTKAFQRNEDSTNKLGVVMGKISGIFSGLLKALEPLANFVVDKLISAFDGLGVVFEKTMKIISKGLAAIGFDGAAKAVDNFTESTKNASKAGEELVKMEQALQKAQRESRKIQLEYQLQAEKLRQIRDDESKSIEERTRANQALGAVLRKQTNDETKIANLRIALANKRIEVDGRTSANLDALAEAETELIDIKERIAGQESEQLANLNSLRKESAELAKKSAEEQAEANAIVEKLASDSLQKIIAARESALKAVNDVKLGMQEEEVDISGIEQYLQDVEAAKLAIKQSGYQNQFDLDRSFLDAEFQMKIANAKKVGASTVLLEKQYAEEKKKIAKAQTGAQLDFASGLMGNLAGLFGENTKAGRLAAVAQIAIDTYKGSMAAWASAQVFPAPFNVIAGGAAVAATVEMGMRSAKAVYAVKSGSKGDSSGGSANFSGVNTAASAASSNMTSTPAFNTLYQSNADTVETAQVISSSQPNPIVRVSEINEVQNSVAVKENSKI